MHAHTKEHLNTLTLGKNGIYQRRKTLEVLNQFLYKQ